MVAVINIIDLIHNFSPLLSVQRTSYDFLQLTIIVVVIDKLCMVVLGITP